MVKIPNGACELVLVNNEPKRNCVKVDRELLEQFNGGLPKARQTTQFKMGSGFIYNGEIYHKNAQYVYIYLY